MRENNTIVTLIYLSLFQHYLKFNSRFAYKQFSYSYLHFILLLCCIRSFASNLIFFFHFSPLSIFILMWSICVFGIILMVYWFLFLLLLYTTVVVICFTIPNHAGFQLTKNYEKKVLEIKNI